MAGGAGSGRRPWAPVLQPGAGRVAGAYLPSTPATVRWGRIAGPDEPPVLTVAPGDLVTVDLVSHEGLLGDQGWDPAGWFGAHGVPAGAVLADAVALAATLERPQPGRHGPHLVAGPVAVAGAEPGDVVCVEVVELVRRVPYGVVSNRHGRGALAGELPRVAPDGSVPAVVSRFATVAGGVAWLQGPAVALPVPLRPMLGLVAVADAAGERGSVEPGPFGGNLDIRHVGPGCRVHLPVQVPGALVQVGDPHFAQGDGEVALTALEGSLRAVLRIGLSARARAPELAGSCTAEPGGAVAAVAGRGAPLVETPWSWVVPGLHRDLDEAVRDATRRAVALVVAESGADEATAYAWLSAAVDLSVSQVVDGVKGVHAVVPKALLARTRRRGHAR